MNFNVDMKMKGWYDIQLLDENMDIIEEYSIDNVICDGIELVDSLADTLVLAVGDSNVPPAATDTALGNELATGSISLSSTKLTEDINGLHLVRYGTGSVTGINGVVRELGLFDTGKTSMISHMQFVDGSGNPAIIYLLPAMTLNITYNISFDVVNPIVSGTATSFFGDIVFSANYLAISDSLPYGVNGFFSGVFNKLFENSSVVFKDSSDGSHTGSVSYSYDVPTRTLTATFTLDASSSGDRTLVRIQSGSNNDPYITLPNLVLENLSSLSMELSFTWSR